MLCLVAGIGMAQAAQVTVTSGPLGIAIPDDDPTGISDTINVTTAGTIADVDVTIDVTHTWAGDLNFSLESPDTTTLDVVDYSTVLGESTDLGGAYTFDDEAATSYAAALAGTTLLTPGSYNNTGTIGEGGGDPLSGFDSGPSNGSWTLTVVDDFGADTGTLNSWSLLLTIEGCGPPGNNSSQIINCDINNDAGNYGAGRGNDTINVNAGTFTNIIDGERGNDTFNVNDGSTSTRLDGDRGDDTFNLNDGSVVTTVDGGRDNDTFNISAGSTIGTVLGDRGNDTFNLNGGMVTTADGGRNNDTFNLNSGMVTTMNGGRNNDTFNLNGGMVTTADGGRNNDTQYWSRCHCRRRAGRQRERHVQSERRHGHDDGWWHGQRHVQPEQRPGHDHEWRPQQ